MKKRLVVFVLTVVVCFLCAFDIFVVDTYATTSSLSLRVGSDSLSLELRPVSVSGTFSRSDDINISVSTNNFNGYSLGIAARSNSDRTLSNGSGEGFSSIESAIADTVFSGSGGAIYNNKWGYLPSRYCSDGTDSTTCANNTTDFLPAPTTLGDVIDITNGANVLDNDYTISIGARANMDIGVDAYDGVFLITAVVNPTIYNITFNKNANNTVTNLPDNLDSSTYDETIVLPGNVPARQGHEFLGWCSVEPVKVDYVDGCSGDVYNPNGSGTNLVYTLDQTGDNTNIVLYAMWRGPILYSMVASLVKTNNGQPRTQSNSDLGATITIPTSNDPATDTSNSGVYLYDKNIYGNASDVDDGYDIYYYRGILDSNLGSGSGSYGSNGDGYYYPNYVLLGSTCWRIIRTTSSGGTKMLYNGIYSNNTCSNNINDAQIGVMPFNDTSATIDGTTYYGLKYRYIQSIGYTYSNDVHLDSTTPEAVEDIFGASGNDATTNTKDSIVKQYIENVWFSNIDDYEDILEPSAGYCNDRTLYTTNGLSLADRISDSTQIVPYIPSTDSVTEYYFGGYVRNLIHRDQEPTLGCPRGVVDLYTTRDSNDGNGQLSKPVAMLTVDEVTFAGSGNGGTAGLACSVYSYSNSGSRFWLMSPGYRFTTGVAYSFRLHADGYSSPGGVSGAYGVRPVISLKSGTMIANGSGTAADPWVIDAPD